MDALLFDCDGVLAETERDGHRVAFNQAFAEFGLDIDWSVGRYGELLSTGGGKERLRRHFEETGWPDTDDPDRLIAALHARKTEIFRQRITAAGIPLRAGVARLVDAAIEAGVPLAVCSTSNADAVRAIVETGLGPARARRIAVFAGDAVAAKKPDPAIYDLAVARLGVDPARTLALEDSRTGVLAAKAAGLRCLVTPSVYTERERFDEADLLVSELGDGVCVRVTLADCRALCADV